MALDKIYINPVITFYGDDRKVHNEGCYSLEKDKYNYPIERSKCIKMTWLDIKGIEHKGMFCGFQAQVLQHEFDHLEGKLCNQNS